MVRTVWHAAFVPFYHDFYIRENGKPIKTVPKFSKLMEHLEWDTFATMFMMDGSYHSKTGCGTELHVQSFSYNAQSRLCIALYQKLGLKAWPVHYGYTERKGVHQFHIRISGSSLPLIREHCLPLMLEAFKYKVPEPSKRGDPNFNSNQSNWQEWYKNYNVNADWLEDITL
jgi:hypothetical protein